MRNLSRILPFGAFALSVVAGPGCARKDPNRFEVLYRIGSPAGGATSSGGATGSGGSGGITVTCSCPDLGALTPCCTPTGGCGYVFGPYCEPLRADAGTGGDSGRGSGGARADGGPTTDGSPDGAGGLDSGGGADSGGRDGATDAGHDGSGGRDASTPSSDGSVQDASDSGKRD